MSMTGVFAADAAGLAQGRCELATFRRVRCADPSYRMRIQHPVRGADPTRLRLPLTALLGRDVGEGLPQGAAKPVRDLRRREAHGRQVVGDGLLQVGGPPAHTAAGVGRKMRLSRPDSEEP